MAFDSKYLGFCVLVLLRWILAKLGSEIREFHQGETHLNRQSDLTGSRESMSVRIRVPSSDMAIAIRSIVLLKQCNGAESRTYLETAERKENTKNSTLQ